MVTPSLAKAKACFLFAGVIRLAAPSSSSAPHRPELESSFMARRKSSSFAIVGRESLLLSAWGMETATPKTIKPIIEVLIYHLWVDRGLKPLVLSMQLSLFDLQAG